jgi:capsule biosynthesis phosphatase
LKHSNPRIVCDLDGTLTIDDKTVDYPDKLPNLEVITSLQKYHLDGFEIVISTSRNMKTFDGNEGKISKETLPVILDWLEKHNVPFDEIYIAKPWCGDNGFYVDDRAIRPNEFLSLSYSEIKILLEID